MGVDATNEGFLDLLLDGVQVVFLRDGFDGTTLEAIAGQMGTDLGTLEAVYPDRLDALVAMFNREFLSLYRGIIDDLERDPRGGLLSRMYTYVLCQIYERPVARSLYLIERNALHDIMSHRHAMTYLPSIEVRRELIESLQNAGMIKAEVDPRVVSEALTVISGGLALTAPHPRLDIIVETLMQMLGAMIDAEVTDTTAGKRAYYDWATQLENGSRVRARPRPAA